MIGDILFIYFILGLAYLIHDLYETFKPEKEGTNASKLEFKAAMEKLAFVTSPAVASLIGAIAALFAAFALVFAWPFWLYSDFKDGRN